MASSYLELDRKKYSSIKWGYIEQWSDNEHLYLLN